MIFSKTYFAKSALLSLLATTALAAAPLAVDPALPTYQPQPYAHPKDAGYLLPDGSIRIVGAQGNQSGHHDVIPNGSNSGGFHENDRDHSGRMRRPYFSQLSGLSPAGDDRNGHAN